MAASQIDRRSLLALAGGAALLPATARAQETRTLIVSIWGFNGDKYTRILFRPFEERHNVRIVLETGNSADRLNKLRARNGAGADVVYLPDVFAQSGAEQRLFASIDRARIPNIADVPAIGQAPQGAAFGPAYTVGRYGIIYDAAKVTPEVTGWADLWRPTLARRVSLPGITTTAGPLTVLVAGARRGVDAYADPAAAFASLAELKPNLVKTYNTGSELVNLFSTGEITVAAAQDFTLPQVVAAVPSVRWAALADGAFAYFNTVNIAVGSRQPELAAAFIDWHLSPEVQHALAVEKVDAPMNRKVVLTPEEASIWTYGESTIAALRTPDYARLNAAKDDWTDRWNDTFGR